jgi:alanyl aminopeptidase
MADPDFAALREHVRMLMPAEQIVYADAVSSAFQQGSLAPGTVLDAMPALSNSGLPQVATALVGELAWIRDYLATGNTRPALDAYTATLYAPHLAALGLGRLPDDTDMTTDLRARLVDVLAVVAQDAALRRQLNQLGRAALGLDSGGTVDLTRLNPDLRGAILKVTVQDSGEPAFKAIVGELATNHQTRQRYEMLAALGATHDPKLAEQARNYGLTPAVAVGEIQFLYGSHVGEIENRDAFWQWLEANYAALAARLPDQFQGVLIRFAASKRCTKSQSDELRDWFAPRLKSIIGGERALAQSLESIDQCAALRAHVGEQALATWAASHQRQ